MEFKIQKESAERDFSRSSQSISGYSFNNKIPLMENINQDILSSEKVFSPKNLSLSPQTVQVLENVETLVKNAQKQLTEINDNILFYKKNPEEPEAQPTIDEDLLRLRQMVAFKFQEANDNLKHRSKYDHKKFTDPVQLVPEEKINKVPRLLKLMTMLPEKCTFRESECYKNYPRSKILSSDSHFSYTPDYMNPKSQDSRQEKAAQTDDKENTPESSNFQIQTGPKVSIQRSLKVQNLEHFHVSPEASFREPANVGIYNFQHETLSEQNKCSEVREILRAENLRAENLRGKKSIKEENLEKKGITREENLKTKEETFERKETPREENSERKQIFRKSVILKNPDDSRKRSSTNRVLEKNSDEIAEANNFIQISDEELIPRCSAEFANLKKSPKQCNIVNAKSKAYFEYLSNLERNSNTNAEEGKLSQENVEKHDIRESKQLPKKPTIISNERVNFKFKDILKGAQFNPPLDLGHNEEKFAKFSKETNIEIDHINLKEPCVFDLDTALKRNNEIIKNVIQNTDMILKTMSSDFKKHNSDKCLKISRNMASLQSPEKKLELIKTTLVENFPEKYSAEKTNQEERNLNRIIKSAIKLPKFMSEVIHLCPNSAAVNQENSKIVSLSSTTVNTMSSKETRISENLLPSVESSLVASNDATLNDLKDLSIDIFSEKAFSDSKSKDNKENEDIRNSVISDEKERKNESKEKKVENKEKKVGDKERKVEDKERKVEDKEWKVEDKERKVEDKERKEENKKSKEKNKESKENTKDTEENKELNFKKVSEENGNKKKSKGAESNANKAPSLKLFLNSNPTPEIVNYSASFSQFKENNHSEMEIFSRIFESLKHSSAVIKRFIACLFGETEARIENEIISILRETGVNATLINQFLKILQNRDKNAQLITFIKDLGSHLNLTDDNNVDSSILRKQLEDFLRKAKINSFNSEIDRKLNREILSVIENKDNKSLQIKLDFDVTTRDKNIYDDTKLVVTRVKADLIKSQEKVNNSFDNLDGDFSWKKLSEEIFVDKNDEMYGLKKDANELNKTEKSDFIEVKSINSAEIRALDNSGTSLIELSKDYSENFTNCSSTPKYCESLESHFSLKLSSSFMNKKEVPYIKEKNTERDVESEIQQKIDNLLDMENRDAKSAEKSIKSEINNLSRESDSQESLKRKSLVRGETFIIKKSNLDRVDKSTEINYSDFNSLSHSQEELKFRTPSISTRSTKNQESSSETFSEGEIRFPSSYSLGEIKIPRQKNMKKSLDQNSLKLKNKNQNSSKSSSNTSKSRSLGEFY